MAKVILTNGQDVQMTENDFARILQRFTIGGVVEGSMLLESGAVIVLQNVAAAIPGGLEKEEEESDMDFCKRVFDKHLTHVTRSAMLEKLGIEDETQSKSELMQMLREKW